MSRRSPYTCACARLCSSIALLALLPPDSTGLRPGSRHSARCACAILVWSPASAGVTKCRVGAHRARALERVLQLYLQYLFGFPGQQCTDGGIHLFEGFRMDPRVREDDGLLPDQSLRATRGGKVPLLSVVAISCFSFLRLLRLFAANPFFSSLANLVECPDAHRCVASRAELGGVVRRASVSFLPSVARNTAGN